MGAWIFTLPSRIEGRSGTEEIRWEIRFGIGVTGFDLGTPLETGEVHADLTWLIVGFEREALGSAREKVRGD